MKWVGHVKPLQRAVLALTMTTGMLCFGQSGWAQTGDAPSAAVSPAAPTAPVPASPPAPSAPAAASPPATPALPDVGAAAKPGDTTGASPGDASISQTIDVQGRPAVILSGSATWDNGFKTLTDAYSKLNQAIGANNLASAGHPLTVFTETDDAGFKYSAMIPIAKAPEGRTEVTPEIKLGETPSGKAIRFQHRAAYDDIDSTYEAITAYLDEKGLEAKNIFAEEYLTMTKTSDDPALEVDVYVFLK